ncbi:MAG: family 78 glycoside hydrolase catalytic domain [Bacteroidaceae bacterium]|nr:family 78 glycoside hydrolase catalytic domain [Bacteroidaceae bacterium]
MRKNVLSFMLLLVHLCAVAEVRIVHQTVNAMTSPVGISHLNPRFGWAFEADYERGIMQEAYSISIYEANHLESPVFSTGMTEGDACVDVCIPDLQLAPCTSYCWKVTTRLNDGTVVESPYACFETAIDEEEMKKVHWIHAPKSNTTPEFTSVLFRKSFTMDDELTTAKIYTSALGIYDLYINGERVGHAQGGETVYDELKPGWTVYSKDIAYQTHDVTRMLRRGSNVITAMVSPGWWSGRISGAPYSNDTSLSFIAKLLMKRGDDVVMSVETDETWMVGTNAPLLLSDIYDGECYDARIEWKGLEQVDSTWTSAARRTISVGKLSTMSNHPVRVRTDLIRSPRKIVVYEGTKDDGSTYGKIANAKEMETSRPFFLKAGETAIFDFGQNLTGWPSFTISATSGTHLHFRFAEMLNDSGSEQRGCDGPEGSLYTANLRSAKARLEYICRGDTTESYHPTSTFFGFRYCELTASEDVEVLWMEAQPVGSDIDETGQFECSDDEVNQLFSNILWSQRDNFVSVPMDCPQRNERVGWTGDAQVFSRTACYNADMRSFYRKWMNDMRNSQKANGEFPNIAPLHKWTYYSASGWADAGIIVPWNTYLLCGDRQILEENYDAMKKYIRFVSSLHTDRFTHSGAQATYGDWLAFEETDKRYMSVAYFAYIADLMRRTASVLSSDTEDAYAADAKEFATLFNDIKKEFQEHYLKADGKLTIQTQTAYLAALKFHLIDEKDEEKARQTLSDLIEKNGYRLSTGFLGTAMLNTTLNEVGLDDVAYQLLFQHECPSWLFCVDQGATTVWERWNSYSMESGFGPVSMNSFNHYAYGAVGEWLYSGVAGIKTDEEQAGFKHSWIQPVPCIRSNHAGEKPSLFPITWASASHRSPYGIVESSWTWDDEEELTLNVIVPPNTTATLLLPFLDGSMRIEEASDDLDDSENMKKTDLKDGGISIDLQSGHYDFSIFTQETSIAVHETSTEHHLYDLTGRRLTTAPQHGIYIQDGRKVMK